MEFNHNPVMLEECIQGLNIRKNGIYVDGTLGGAGHSLEIVKRLSSNGKLIGIDRDLEALKAAKERLKEFKNVEYIHGNHDDIKQILKEKNIDLIYEEDLNKFLINKNKNLEFGARPLRRAIQRYIEDEISDLILKSELKNGQKITITFDTKLHFNVQ